MKRCEKTIYSAEKLIYNKIDIKQAHHYTFSKLNMCSHIVNKLLRNSKFLML